MSRPSVLLIYSSAEKNLLGGQTGYFLPEAAHPYYVFAKHCDVEFCSLTGKTVVDETSVQRFAEDKECIEFLKDETVKAKFDTAKKISDLSPKDWDVIFYIGGHAPVIDLPESPVNIKFATEFYKTGKITAAVCHGTAALANIKDENGQSIFLGKRFTGFSNAEEEALHAVKAVPFLLEDKIQGFGGIYEKADEPWGVKVVEDYPLYTGQNPASAGPLAEAILKKLLK